MGRGPGRAYSPTCGRRLQGSEGRGRAAQQAAARAQGPALGLMLCPFCLETLGDLCPRAQSRGAAQPPVAGVWLPVATCVWPPLPGGRPAWRLLGPGPGWDFNTDFRRLRFFRAPFRSASRPCASAGAGPTGTRTPLPRESRQGQGALGARGGAGAGGGSWPRGSRPGAHKCGLCS